MKVVVAPDGAVSFDVLDVNEAVALVSALRTPGPDPDLVKYVDKVNRDFQAERKRLGLDKPRPTGLSVPLSPPLLDTWRELQSHPEGRRVKELAATQGVTLSRASARVNTLVRRGMARKVRRGLYRVS